MNSEELFKKLLGLEEPWYIKEIRFDHEDKRVDIWIDFQKGSRFKCPLCGKQCGVHETGGRTWKEGCRSPMGKERIWFLSAL